MATTETLLTFLVQCPSSTRTVSLLGSWDNFSKPYPMRRDSRIGSEHWKGCHSFKNIICDGNFENVGSCRDGGLKMGGTYWYYYQLDGDIEFHNSAEPSTTACPLLPGQLVNVLQVPFHFSGRGRNASIDSTSSDLRTMDPEMKYLNPRPAPVPKCRLPRLKTSPELAQSGDLFDQHPGILTPLSASSGSSARSHTQGSGVLSHLKVRIPGTRSHSRSPSTSPVKQGGFLATLRHLASRSGDSDVISDESRYTPTSTPSYEQSGCPPRTASTERWVTETSLPGSHGASRSHPSLNSLRHIASASSLVPPTAYQTDVFGDVRNPLFGHSFPSNKGNRSRSRDPSPLRNSLIISKSEGHSRQPSGTGLGLQQMPLDTLEEAPSQQTSPLENGGQPMDSMNESRCEVDRNKRLPTLPNSPSSAYEQSPSSSFDDDHLRSHFSAMTLSSCAGDSPIDARKTGVSKFSTALTNSILVVNRRPGYETPTFSESIAALPSLSPSPYRLSSEPQTPTLADHASFPTLGALPLEFSSSTISTQASDLISTTSGGESDRFRGGYDDYGEDYDPYKPARLFQYRLPNNTQDTGDQKIDHLTDSAGISQYHNDSVTVKRHNSITKSSRPAFEHSSSMQRLMDELSYLGNMIST